MRTETSNTFNDGLVMDLHPLSTPNTVLTDCVNGTYLTYNGNEFSLQNDMGNYKLKYCKLSPNYIPVGVREYGDILYIVSHNPLKNCVEIGSYPSPLKLNASLNDSEPLKLEPIIDTQIINIGVKEDKYTKLMKNSTNISFNGVKLNPGDEYQLNVDGEIPYRYETLEYNILDEDSNIHNITEKITVNSSEYKNIQ